MYMFGGSRIDERYNDIWIFDLNTQIWNELNPKGKIPQARNGHTFFAYKQNLFLFGGIHDITYEVNDFCVYSPELNYWHEIDKDSSHQIDETTQNNKKS